MTTSIERTINVPFRPRIYFTHPIFAPTNHLLAQLVSDSTSDNPAKVLVGIDPRSTIGGGACLMQRDSPPLPPQLV
jgi:hypothetical protein